MDSYSTSVIEFFTSKQKNKEGHFIVGNCYSTVQKTIKAKLAQVVISEVTIEKNIKHHNDLNIVDYEVLDSMFTDYDLLVKDGEKTVGIMYTKKYQYYYALKATKSGESIFLTSFRKTNNNDIKRIRNKSKKGLVDIIIDKLD